MKKYKVAWVQSTTEDTVTIVVEAENCDEAFRKAVEDHTNASHPNIYVYRGWGVFDHNEFINPHHPENQNTLSSKIRKQTQSVDHLSREPSVRADGSIGWFERIDGTSLTEKQILLAQLNELRVIKRCVVGTVVVAVFIPIVISLW